LKKIGKRITSKPVKLPILDAPENVIVEKSCSFADHFPGLSVYRLPLFVVKPQSGRAYAMKRPMGTRSSWTTGPGIEIPGWRGLKTFHVSISLKWQDGQILTSIDRCTNADPEQS